MEKDLEVVLGRKEELSEIELLSKMVNSEKMKDLIEKRIDEKIMAMEKDLETKYKIEVEGVNKEVENMREMFLQSELKRLTMREEELKIDKATHQAEKSDDEVHEVSHDVNKKVELIELKVDQLKLNFVEFTKQYKDKRTADEEMEVVKGKIQELFRGRNNLITIEEELKLLKDNIMSIDKRLESIAKNGEGFEDLSSRKTESESQSDKLEDIKIMANNL